MLWTHYYDYEVLSANPKLAHKFSPPQSARRDGIDYTWVLQSYKESLNWQGFCGGGHETSVWLTGQSILDCLAGYGFCHQQVAYEYVAHPHGPSFAVIASRFPFAGATAGGDVAAAVAARFVVTVMRARVDDEAFELSLRLEAQPGLEARPLGLFVAVEVDGRPLIVPDEGEPIPFAEDRGDIAPLRLIDPVSQDLELRRPPRAWKGRVSGLYVGFGAHFAEVIERNAWARLPLPPTP